MSDDDFRSCPMCGEQVRAAARKCRFCGEMLDASPDPDDEARIREAARKLIREDRDKATALQIFLTGLIPCGLSPVIALYGTVFLLLRRHHFPRKSLAVVGTAVSWMWTLILIGIIAFEVSKGRRW